MFRTTIVALLATALLAAGCARADSTAGGALVDIGAGINGPAGVSATVYATGLEHVAAFAFDAEDRLWIATAEYTDTGNDAVYVVTAAGASPVKVIRAVHTPLGLVWYHGSLYVASKESVVAYGGLQGTRFATHRTIVSLPSGVGEVNNLVVAPNGRMLLGISSPCDHCTPASKYSGALLSFTPDGKDLRVYASGIRAPVGLTYFPNTSDLFVTMDYRDDLGAKTTGDALAVVPAGTAWRNPTCYGQGGTACTGVPAVTGVLDQHAAVSGVAIVTGELGTTVGTAAIVAEWALGKVQRVVLTKSGDTYTGATTAFLTGVKNPVALIMSSDHALFVGDWSTGKVYRIAKASAANAKT
jgi:glucose/arabinose dehydrogenase